MPLSSRPFPATTRPAIPAGERVYAVGDIHGRSDLFEALIDAIERDDAASQKAKSTVILLGDLVDRGPASAAVADRALHWRNQRRVRIIAGNHEEMFLESLRDADVLEQFLRYGGRETLLSYGIEAGPTHRIDWPALQALMERAIPSAHLAFMRGLEDWIAIGDYAFVHAGIRPGIALADQSPLELRWIREPFLSHPDAHSHVIVHGHTIVDEVEFRGNRIGIDTGAFRSGRLTALVLEGTARKIIRVESAGNTVSESVRKVEE